MQNENVIMWRVLHAVGIVNVIFLCWLECRNTGDRKGTDLGGIHKTKLLLRGQTLKVGIRKHTQ